MFGTKRLASVLLLLIALPVPAIAKDDTRTVVARVSVAGDGFVRVAADELRRVGISSPDAVSVERHGQPVPVCASANDGELVFLAADTAGPHTAKAVYELVRRAAASARTLTASAAEAVRAADAARPSVRIDAGDKVFGDLAGGRARVYAGALPVWFLGRLDSEDDFEHELDPRGAFGVQRIRAHVYGTYVGPVAMWGDWGDADLGIAKVADAAGGAVLEWEVAADAVPKGAATLLLANRSPKPPPPARNDTSRGRGQIWVDRVTMNGDIIPSFALSLCRCDASGPGPIHIQQVPTRPSARYGVVTDGSGKQTHQIAVPAAARAAPWLRIDGADLPRGSTLYLAATARSAKLTPVGRTSDPLAQAREARHVILCVPRLVEEARRLAAHRSNNGIPSAVVDVVDVYDAYGHGEQTVEALRSFIAALQERTTPLDYLLLVGDAIYDRTDWSSRATIPVPMGRTLWNGATPSDQLYVSGDDPGQPTATSVGRLPFRKPKTLRHYVDRVIQHEERPVADDHRRLLRFLAGDSGMGVVVDRVLELAFRRVLSEALATPFEVEVTTVSPLSAFFWPLADLNSKVVRDINRGCLIYTYVGHGTSHRRSIMAWDGAYEIFTEREVDFIDILGPRPLFLVLASGTAAFDSPKRDGIGEALLKRSGGPLAYWGSSRFVHPIYNALVARGLASAVGAAGADRVGPYLDRARQEVLRSSNPAWEQDVFRIGSLSWPGLMDLAPVIKREGNTMYGLLGDPALRMLLPRSDLRVTASRDGDTIEATAQSTSLPDGTEIRFSLVRARNDRSAEPKPTKNATDPKVADAVRTTQRKANDRSLDRKAAALQRGRASVRFTLARNATPPGLAVVAHTVSKTDVHHGACPVK